MNTILDRTYYLTSRLNKDDIPEDVRVMINELIEGQRDKITGMQLRRAFDEAVSELIRRKSSFAIIAIDILNLGGMNAVSELKGRGHELANEILSQIAQIINRTAQILKGMAYRSGGDEMHIVTCNGDLEEILCALGKADEKILEVIENYMLERTPHLKHDGLPTGAGFIDYGVAYSKESGDKGKLIGLADHRAYEAKKRRMERIADQQRLKGERWIFNSNIRAWRKITESNEKYYRNITAQMVTQSIKSHFFAKNGTEIPSFATEITLEEIDKNILDGCMSSEKYCL